MRGLSACEIKYNTIASLGVDTPELRREQIALLEEALRLDEESRRMAGGILEMADAGK